MLIGLILALARKNITIHSTEFNHDLKQIQDMLGVDDGGYAGMIFSDVDETWQDQTDSFRADFLSQYVKNEIDSNLSSLMDGG